MNTKKKVYEALSKELNKKQTQLSALSDLEKWNDFYGLDDLAFKQIRSAKDKIYEAQVALDDFENANVQAEEEYEDFYSNLNSNMLRGYLSEAIDLMGNFEVLADELGIDPNSNEAYLIVKEQTITDYPELIGLAEELEKNADLYFETVGRYIQ